MKSKCAWLVSYNEGELPEDRRKTFEEHLHSCPTCWRQLERLNQLRENLRKETVPSVDSYGGNRIYANFLDKVKQRSSARTRWRFVYSLVFFALCLAFVSPIFLMAPPAFAPGSIDLEKNMLQSYELPPLPATGLLDSNLTNEYSAVFSFVVPSESYTSLLAEISKLKMPSSEEEQRLFVGLDQAGEDALLAKIREFPRFQERDFLGLFRATIPLPGGESLLIVQSGQIDDNAAASLVGAVVKSQLLGLQSHWAIYPLVAALILLILRIYWRKKILDWLFLVLLFASMIFQIFGPQGDYRSEIAFVNEDYPSGTTLEIERNPTTTRFLLGVPSTEEKSTPFYLPLRGREAPSIYPQDWWFIEKGEIVAPQYELITLHSGWITLLLFLSAAVLQVLCFLLPLLLWVFVRRREQRESELVKIADGLPKVIQGKVRP